jgi:hypothetical protein
LRLDEVLDIEQGAVGAVDQLGIGDDLEAGAGLLRRWWGHVEHLADL